jgi:hypothetical protein
MAEEPGSVHRTHALGAILFHMKQAACDHGWRIDLGRAMFHVQHTSLERALCTVRPPRGDCAPSSTHGSRSGISLPIPALYIGLCEPIPARSL